MAPVLIGAAILTFKYSSFRLSLLLYRLLFIHAIILMVGGHYTYAGVPAGFWLQDLLDLSRSPYDRLGYLVQGFVPAILTREILMRLSPLKRGKWLFFLVVCVCLAFSAFYEMLEWCAALLGGEPAEKVRAPASAERPPQGHRAKTRASGGAVFGGRAGC